MISVAAERNLLPIRRPARLAVIETAVGGQLDLIGAVGIHDEYFLVTVPVAGKGDLGAIG